MCMGWLLVPVSCERLAVFDHGPLSIAKKKELMDTTGASDQQMSRRHIAFLARQHWRLRSRSSLVTNDTRRVSR